jgi:hypothetical protein
MIICRTATKPCHQASFRGYSETVSLLFSMVSREGIEPSTY